jgi:hypothetical protein
LQLTDFASLALEEAERDEELIPPFSSFLQVLPQMLRDLQIPQAAQCLGLDLARALAGHPQ